MVDRLNSLLMSAYARLVSVDLRREEGQTLTEYALVLGVIVVAVIVALETIGGGVKSNIQSVCHAIAGSSANCG